MERITDKYVFFWNGELSNWYGSGLIYESLAFYNSEQAFMWKKAIFFGDSATAVKIMILKVLQWLNVWDDKLKTSTYRNGQKLVIKLWLMLTLLSIRQKPLLKDLLLSTGDKIIVEVSPYDKIWGIGLHWEDDDVLDESKWKGQNLLGKALMEVRKQLSNGKV